MRARRSRRPESSAPRWTSSVRRWMGSPAGTGSPSARSLIARPRSASLLARLLEGGALREPSQVGLDVRIASVQDPGELRAVHRVAHHHVGGGEFVAEEILPALQVIVEDLEPLADRFPGLRDDRWDAL